MQTQRLDANPPIHFLRLFSMRLLMALALVLGTYNPSGTSFYHWVAASPDLTPAHIFTGILLFSLAIAILRMAFLSVGYFGTVVTLLMLTMGVVLCLGLGLIDISQVRFTTYVIQIWLAIFIAIGTSWPFVQKRLSGERDVLRSPP